MSRPRALARLFAVSIAFNLIMLGVLKLVHAQHFSWLFDPLSWLGKLATDEGHVNTTGFVLFVLTMLANAGIWVRVESLLRKTRFGQSQLIRLLGKMVFAGFILMAFPCDRFVSLHSLGGGLLVGGLWAFSGLALYRSRKHLHPALRWGLQIVLHITALYCGWHFVFDTTLKGFSQRPLVLAIAGCVQTALRSQSTKIPPRPVA